MTAASSKIHPLARGLKLPRSPAGPTGLRERIPSRPRVPRCDLRKRTGSGNPIIRPLGAGYDCRLHLDEPLLEKVEQVAP
jgi:hypothetical protein